MSHYKKVARIENSKESAGPGKSQQSQKQMKQMCPRLLGAYLFVINLFIKGNGS